MQHRVRRLREPSFRPAIRAISDPQIPLKSFHTDPLPCGPLLHSARMDQDQLRALLAQVQSGAVDVDAAMERMRHLPFEDLGFAKVDHHRALRHGIPEVVFGKGKTGDHVAAIVSSLLARASNILVTRASAEIAERLKLDHPDAEYFPASGAVRVWRDHTIHGKGKIAVVCAGTSDLPVAEEAQVTAEVMGNEVDAIHDIGVAGIHRLMQNRERLTEARVVIVCAGMEGALPSVIGGLVAVPVIAVPTSVGYGASFQGLAALLGMLNSCASNVTVVNIDNGFGAGYAASLMNRL
jgi:NCAIR mutase (PurE)-related protein